jgi:hypothetical protein
MARRKRPNRVDFARNADDFRCALMGALGYSAQFIEQETGLSDNQIRYRLAKAHIKMRDFRNGNSKMSRRVLTATSEMAATHLRKEVRLIAG